MTTTLPPIMPPIVPLELLARSAQREVEALTLIPRLAVPVEQPDPEIRLEAVACRCGARTAPPPPIREAVYGSSEPGSAAVPRLPTLTILRCEELTARSLLWLSLRDGPSAPHVMSRAVFWERHADADWRSPSDVVRALELLDAAEENGLVAPMTSRPAGGPAGGIGDLVTERRSAHFLTTHASGEYARLLDDAYRALRLRLARPLIGV